MNNQSGKQQSKFYIAAIVLIGVAVLSSRSDLFYFGALSDNDIIDLFHRDRPAFIKLQKMIAEDRVSSVTEQYVDPNLTRARWKQYYALMKKISHSLTITYSPQSTRFVFSGGRFLSIGPEWTKGIVYATNPGREGAIRSSLNNPSELASGEVYLRKIQRDWFVFFEKTH